MELLITLGRTFGFSLAAGVNLYATVAILGLASRYDWVALPEQYRLFDNSWVIYTALALFVVEFVADKVPWFDTIWDGIHTAIRPLGGALVAVSTLGDASTGVQGIVALMGGGLAASSHVTKATARVTANASPEPFSNWALSLGEDVFVLGLALLALQYPLLALGVVALSLLVTVVMLAWIVRALRRRFSGPRPGVQAAR